MKLFDLEAEYSVLGSMIVQPSFIFRGIELLQPGDFFKEQNKYLFKFLRDLVAEGYTESQLNEISFKDELVKRGLLEKVGGEEHLGYVIEFALDTFEKFESACKIVKDKALLRKILDVAKYINEKIEERPDPDALIDDVEKKVFSLSEERITNTLVPVGEIIPDIIRKIEELSMRREMVTGLPSGFSELDKMTSGFHNSDLIILAARPSMGKTAFSLSIAYNVAVKENKVVAFFSLEMSKEQIVTRLISQDCGIPLYKIRSGWLKDEEIEKILISAEKIREAPIYIDDTPGISILEMRAKARRLQSERGLDLIVVDYLQLMRGIRRTESRQQEVSEISRSLKALAKELNVPVIALSQLSRQVEHRSDKRPQLSDLRESGSIEQDADVVMFIHRPEVYKKNPDPEEQGIAEIIIAKQRNGPTGTIRLAFIKELTRFENLEENTIQIIEEKQEKEEVKTIDEQPFLTDPVESSGEEDTFSFDDSDDYDFDF
ncbi:MAG: replicative DNA helicase [Desulfurobacteriaceae bacterium]